jgi:hypothetical protein
MELFCGQQGEALAQVNAQLPTETAQGPGSRAITLDDALIEDSL